MLDNFLRAFLTRIAAPRHRGRPARRMSPALHLKIEILEDRLTHSTLIVTNNADSGTGSLRAAIANAASGDTIVFAKSVHAITLTTAELAISKSLDIEGPGADKLTISGNNASRVFHIEGASTVTIANLTVAHGQSSGQLPASAVGTYEGTGSGAGGGGGILNEAPADLALNKYTVCDNQALGAVGFTVVGGGLLNLGTATVQSCMFSNNQVTGGGAYDALGGSGGAGIDSFGGAAGGSKLTVVNSTFCNNTASAAGGSSYFGLGGGIEIDGGLNSFDPTAVEESTATITNSAIVNNLATGGPEALTNGGGLCIIGGNVTLVGCTIAGNRAVGGGGGTGLNGEGDSEAIGGGVENGVGTLNVLDCTITGNQAIGGNNAIISDGDPNAGGAFGGGIQNNIGGVVIISNSVIAGNIAQGGATTAGPGSDAVGGGIENSTGFTDPPLPVATLMMSNCVVAGNSAIAGHGGPGTNSNLVSAQAGFAFGGGIDCSHNGSIALISDSLITGNNAIGSAGGSGNNGGNAYGGGLAIGWGTLFDQPEGSQLTLINSVVVGNQAVGGRGGAGANGGDGLGGGFYIAASCSAAVNASAIAFNVAFGGEEGTGGNDGRGSAAASTTTERSRRIS